MKTTATVYFIRHGQLIRPYNDHFTMTREILADLALSKLDPTIRDDSETTFRTQTRGLDFSKIKYIYYNNSGFQSRRSLNSAKLIQSVLKKRYRLTVPIMGLPELKEIKFFVKKLVSSAVLKTKGMPILRTELFRSIRSGGHAAENKSSINIRTKKVLSIIAKHQEAGDSVLFVTHDFFMRFLQIALERKATTEKNLQATHLNEYFGGFTLRQKAG